MYLERWLCVLDLVTYNEFLLALHSVIALLTAKLSMLIYVEVSGRNYAPCHAGSGSVCCCSVIKKNRGCEKPWHVAYVSVCQIGTRLVEAFNLNVVFTTPFFSWLHTKVTA